MKKQGVPAPLDESKVTLLKKRKAAEAGSVKLESDRKRHRAVFEADDSGDEDKGKIKGASGKKIANGTTGKTPKNTTGTQNKGFQRKQMLIASDEEDEDDNDDVDDVDDSSFDEDGVLADEFDDLDGVSDGSEGIVSGDDSGSDGSEDSAASAGVSSAFDSDDEGHARETMFSEDEELSDAEERLTAANIEGLSRKLDEQKRAEAEEAEKELQDSAMQTNIAGDRPDVFADDADAAGKHALAPDLQLLRTRITDTIRILGDLKALGQPGKSRTDYVDLLLKDICTYYGYSPFLAEKLFSLFTPMEAFAFFEANETPRPVVIRTNTLRTNRRSLAQALINRGVVLEPVGKWSKVGLQVFESAVPLGATPEYLAGHYILQAASSFLPVMALAPQPNERILDMAAAPGGKSTYIAALMRNTGCLIANDASKPRAKGLIGNIHRLGCKNTIVTNLDARTAFPKAMGGFDRVLLDAPCTGTGVISKDSSVKTSKNERDFLAIPHIQRQLLLAAIDSVDHASKTGGYIVYSTCSVTVEENEAVVQYALRKRPNLKIVDTGLGDFGSQGMASYMGKQFDPKMTLTRRYFPHRENVDGFFVCKLKKTGPSPTTKSGTSGASSSVAGTLSGASESNTAMQANDGDDMVVDKTPIADESGTVLEPAGVEFGPFDDDEDKQRIERAERTRLRRKGINPKAILNKAPTQQKTDLDSRKNSSAKTSERAGARNAGSTEKEADKRTEKKKAKKEKK